MFHADWFCNCWSVVSSFVFTLSRSVFICVWIFLKSFAEVAHCSDFLNCVFSSFIDVNSTLRSSTTWHRESNLSSFMLISFRSSSYVSTFIVPSLSGCWQHSFHFFSFEENEDLFLQHFAEQCKTRLVAWHVTTNMDNIYYSQPEDWTHPKVCLL